MSNEGADVKQIYPDYIDFDPRLNPMAGQPSRDDTRIEQDEAIRRAEQRKISKGVIAHPAAHRGRGQ